MPGQSINIRCVFDDVLWEKVQDQIAKLTGTSVICLDSDGVPVTKPSGLSGFCEYVRRDEKILARCLNSDTLAGQEAMKSGKPLVYLCHCGLVDVAVPIIAEGKFLGSVLFGQLRLSDDKDKAKVKSLENKSSRLGVDMDLLRLREQLPEISYSRIQEIAELIGSLVNYIVEKAVLCNKVLTDPKLLAEIVHGKQQEQLNEEQHLTEEGEILPISQGSVIYPSINYIKNHLNESITMRDMANLCHLSPSYFSRLFGRELGENFVSYVNRQKIQLAKSMLRETNKSVSQIASELSYQDASHFINLFKRFEGVTPQVYRQVGYK